MRTLVFASIALAASLVAAPPATACGSIHAFGVAGDLMEASDDAGRIGDYSLALTYAKLAEVRAEADTTSARRDLTPFLKPVGTFWQFDREAAKAAGRDPAKYRGACVKSWSEAAVRKWRQASLYVARAGRSETTLDAAEYLPLSPGKYWDSPIVQALCPE